MVGKTQTVEHTELGVIPSDWRVVKFSDILQDALRNGLTKPTSVRGNGIKMINMGELFRHDRIKHAEMERVPLSESERKLYLLEHGDLLFARQSLLLSGVGKCSIFIEDKEEVTFEGHLIRARINKGIANPVFYYYFFKSSIGRNVIEAYAEQVAAAGIRGSDLKNVPVPFPPLTEQVAIGNLLHVIDEKIELNQRMNRTLEAVGGALFRRWFVDFEFPNQEGKPYKTTGGKMQYNEELGKEIPEGWSVRALGDFIQFIKGRKPVSVSATQESSFVPLILIDSLNGNQETYAWDKDGILVEETDTLMVMDGASSGRVERGKRGLLGSTLAKIETRQIGKAYLYHFLKEKETDINENTTGTSIPHADKGRINSYYIAVPKEECIIKHFEAISNSLLLKSINNSRQNRTLQEIRDSLLPRLMSGKIRVTLNKETVEAT